MSARAELRCHACRRVASIDGVVSRSASCDGCGAELRCCLNCRFHDKSAYNECAEPSAERILEKGRANFCDYFAPGSSKTTSPASEPPPTMSDLERLFAKK